MHQAILTKPDVAHGVLESDATSDVVMKAPPKFTQSPRIQKLAQRSRELAISGKRRLGAKRLRWGQAVTVQVIPAQTWP